MDAISISFSVCTPRLGPALNFLSGRRVLPARSDIALLTTDSSDVSGDAGAEFAAATNVNGESLGDPVKPSGRLHRHQASVGPKKL